MSESVTMRFSITAERDSAILPDTPSMDGESPIDLRLQIGSWSLRPDSQARLISDLLPLRGSGSRLLQLRGLRKLPIPPRIGRAACHLQQKHRAQTTYSFRRPPRCRAHPA